MYSWPPSWTITLSFEISWKNHSQTCRVWVQHTPHFSVLFLGTGISTVWTFIRSWGNTSKSQQACRYQRLAGMNQVLLWLLYPWYFDSCVYYIVILLSHTLKHRLYIYLLGTRLLATLQFFLHRLRSPQTASHARAQVQGATRSVPLVGLWPWSPSRGVTNKMMGTTHQHKWHQYGEWPTVEETKHVWCFWVLERIPKIRRHLDLRMRQYLMTIDIHTQELRIPSLLRSLLIADRLHRDILVAH